MSERSANDREAARLERERRRAAKRGDESPAPEAEPTPAPPDPATPDDIEPPQWVEAEPVGSSAAPPSAQQAPPQRRSFPRPATAADDGPPNGVRPITPQPGAPGMPQRPITVPRRRRAPGRLVFLGVFAAFVLAAIIWFLLSIFTPFKGDGSGVVVVQIPKGTGTRDVGDLLADKGVVGSGFFFSLRAKIAGNSDEIRAGTHRMHEDMGNKQALDALTAAPPSAAATTKLVLPEGPSRRENVPRVAAAGVTGSYVKASESSPILDPRAYGAPKGASLEGFLFPATYDLKAGSTARGLVRKQVQAYKDNTKDVSYTAARRKNLTRFDVLTIASMIERETAVAKERRLVAAVIYNRLKRGMPLGIDATTRYAVNNWTRPLKVSQLQSTSPYNTRNHTGLPPGPIGNPGLSSIKAAANPRQISYVYYVVKPCGNGAHNFSSSEAQFERDVAAYDAKRRELGGKDPSTCPK